MEFYDVGIIGGGPAGYVSAIRASQLGLKTLLVERDKLGGICLNWGCIPTKSMLHSVEILQLMQKSEIFGIKTESVKFDLDLIVQRSRTVSAELNAGIIALMKKNGVTIVYGSATLKSVHNILDSMSCNALIGVSNTNYAVKSAIIATGARAKVLQGFEPDGTYIWSYKEALMPKVVPSKLTIIGSGAIGMEFASFYSALGSQVTVLEAQNSILPAEDAEIALLARKMFEKQGIKFYTNVKLIESIKQSDCVVVKCEINGEIFAIKSDKVLVAVGITPNSEGLGLEEFDIKLNSGHIVVDELNRTSCSNIYAIGDVASKPYLAHKASHEGIVVAEVIANLSPKPILRTQIPSCTYSIPQIASVGMTEQEALKLGYNLKIGKFSFIGNGKAVVLDAKDGMVKTIFNSDTGELLGAHMVGAKVTELINHFVLGMTLEATEIDLMHSIAPHPTLSESLHESVLSAYSRAIHI